MIGDKKYFFQILETLLINAFTRSKKNSEISINVNYLLDQE